MSPIETRLIESLKKLPSSRTAQVLDFVEFLISREERTVTATRRSDVPANIKVVGAAPCSTGDWQAFMHFRAEFGPVPDDFMADREQGEQGRDPFDFGKD